MKFLIFNIIVSFSLGYILFSNPNENFNEWIGNTKTKISQISKKEIISTLQKATTKKGEDNKTKKPDINDIILKPKNKKNNLKFLNNINETNIIKNIKKKDINVKKPSNEQQNIKQVINQVLVDKKINKLINDNFRLNENKHIEKINGIKKIEVTSKFMTFEQRQNALAELITDMEIYHLNGLKN